MYICFFKDFVIYLISFHGYRYRTNILYRNGKQLFALWQILQIWHLSLSKSHTQTQDNLVTDRKSCIVM